jgi:hypothetical protein
MVLLIGQFVPSASIVQRSLILMLCELPTTMLNGCNSLVRIFQMAKDRMFSPDAPEVAIRIYGVISRVTSREGLKVLALDEFGASTSQTGNIVYQQVLSTWHGAFLHAGNSTFCVMFLGSCGWICKNFLLLFTALGAFSVVWFRFVLLSNMVLSQLTI